MNKLIKGLILGALLAGLAACGGGATADGGSTGAGDLTISGNLNGASLMGKGHTRGENGKFDISISNLELFVTALPTTSDDVITKKAAVAADGSFSVSFPSVTNAVISAMFRDKTNTGATFSIKFETDTTNLSTGSNLSDSYALKGNISLGTLAIAGNSVVIKVSDIASNVDVAAPTTTGYDFGGVWTASAVTLSADAITEGYFTAEDPVTPPAGGWSCGDEPCMAIGAKVSVVKIEGKEFTKGAGCTDDSTCPDTAGSIGAANKYGVSLWGGDTTSGQIKDCGFKTGFTAASARYGAGIHIPTAPTIDGKNMTMADFTFASFDTNENTGGPNNDNQPWMKTAAKPTRDLYDCFNTTKGPLKVNVCKSVVKNGGSVTKTYYSAHSSGGCTDSTGKAIRVTNWSNSGTCGTQTAVTGATGMFSQTCTYNGDPDDSTGFGGDDGPLATMDYSCTHTNGNYDDAALTVPYTYNYTTGDTHEPATPIATTADLCSDIDYTDAGLSADEKKAKKLLAYQCYAQNLENGSSPSGCTTRYRFNWAATDPAQFVMTEGRERPKENFITDLATYSADGNTFFVNSVNKETVAISGGATGNMEFCEIETSTKITGKKVSDSKQLVSVVENGSLLDSTKAACVAAVDGADTWENGNLSHRVKKGMKLMFYLNK